MSSDVTIELMQLHLPAPVAPAMSTCGSVVTSSITDLPEMSRPRPTPSAVVLFGHLGRGEHVAERDDDALLVRHLDADRAAPGDRGEDAHVERRHRVLDVVAQPGDPVDLHPGAELQLVPGDGRADGGTDEAGLHPVVREGGLEDATALVDEATVGFLAGPPLQDVGGRQLPRTVLAAGFVAQLDDELPARVLVGRDLDRRVGDERGLRHLGVGFGFRGGRSSTP